MIPIGAVGYAISTLGYLLLTVLLIAGWEGRSRGLRLIIAAAVTAAWGTLMALMSLQASPALLPAALADGLRNGAWLLPLAQLAGTGHLSRGLVRGAYIATVALLVGLLWTGMFRPALLQDLATVGGLLLPLVGLVLLEQIYRSLSRSGRWSLLYLYIGLGGVFVYDVFLYSQALLLDGISQDAWLARGYVTALAVPFVAVAARRNTAWSLQLFVSRDVVFHTTTFVAVGGYLTLMAAGGYLVRLVGGSWGAVAQIVFLAAAAGLLVILVGSAALRQRVRVFLVKHFYRNKYDYREEWLRFIATLSAVSQDETAPVTAIRAVAQIVGSQGAALFTPMDGVRRWRLEASWPVGDFMSGPMQYLDCTDGLLDWLGQRQWVIDLAEYRTDRNAYDGLELPGWLVARQSWRLVVPVMLRERLYGILLLQEPAETFELTFEDRDLLKTAARHIATYIAQYDSERKLTETREFAAFHKLSAFMMHDLKNVSAQLDLIVSNAVSHRNNPEFVDDVFETVAGVSRRISGLIANLQTGVGSGKEEVVVLAEAIRAAVDRTSNHQPRAEFRDEGEGVLVRASAEQITNVIEHVIGNAQDAVHPNGRVEVVLRRAGANAAIEVIDDGVGMSAEFIREELFRPFHSTKGSKGMGIGAYQAREYVQAIGGFIEVESVPGKGTCFRMVLPQAGLTGDGGGA